MISQKQHETDENQEMQDAIEIRRRRERRWREKGERSIGQNLALMGSLGWLMVAPILAGVFVGRALDKAFGQEVMWTASFIFLGVAAGGVLVWNRIKDEPE